MDRLDCIAFLLIMVYAKYLNSTKIRKQELLGLLVSCYNFNQENNILTNMEKIELLVMLVDTSYVCQNYYQVIDYAMKLIALPIPLEREAFVFNYLGIAYGSTGQYKKALESKKKYLSISRELGDKWREAFGSGNLGNAYYSIGQYEKAVECHETHLKISKELGRKDGEGSAYGNLGNAYNSLGLYEKALKCHEKHLQISKELGDKAGEAKAYCHIGIVYTTTGLYKKALGYHEKHLKLSRELGDRVGEGVACSNLGNAYDIIGQHEKALEFQEKSLYISRKLGDIEGEGFQYCNLAIAHYYLGHYHSSCRYLYQSILILDNLRRDFIQRDQFNITIASYNFRGYKSLASCLVKLNQIKKALLVLDVGRAKALSDLIRLNSEEMKDTTWKERYTKWIDEIPCTIDIQEDAHSYISSNICHSLQGGSVVVFGLDLSDNLLIWVLTEQETFFREWSPTTMTAWQFFQKIVRMVRWDIEVQRSEFSLEDDRNTLRERNMKIFYHLSEQKKTLNLVAGEMSEEYILQKELRMCIEIPETRKERGEFENSQNNETQSPTNPQATEAWMRRYLHGTYKALIGPVQDLLTGSKLVIVPLGPLFLLPFSALLDSDGNYLCERYSIQITPALHTLNASLKVPFHALGPALFVGNPTVGRVYFGGKIVDPSRHLQPLPHAELEASECARCFDAEPLLKEYATKATVLAGIRKASIVHIAAHGNMDYAEIFLAPNAGVPSPAEEKHYLLMPDDISKCAVGARLVVLSCCHSGSGAISAEGVVGIARSFLGAGARAVLIALWRLPDKETQKFMKLFYENICSGFSVCTALQQVNLKFIAENYDRKTWAPFEIFGEDVIFTSEDLEVVRKRSRENRRIDSSELH